jgi:BirA family biotin operon repressor/biotin-[acetyl-CoA-carboxylase] ligase
MAPLSTFEYSIYFSPIEKASFVIKIICLCNILVMWRPYNKSKLTPSFKYISWRHSNRLCHFFAWQASDSPAAQVPFDGKRPYAIAYNCLRGENIKIMSRCDGFNAGLLCAHGIHYFPRLGSTNDQARRLAEDGAPGGTVVLADAQSAGRGRRGRAWHSPPGKGLYFSLLLRPPEMSPPAAAPLTLAAAAAAARKLRQSTGVPVAVKWPNDLLVGAKKLGGILTEARCNERALLYIVLGMGLNVNHRAEDFPPELRGSATSLYLERGIAFERIALLLDLLEDLRRSVELFFQEGFAPFLPLWKELSATLGREVRLAGGGAGKAVDLDADGALLVEDEQGRRRRLTCGEIVS